VPGTTDIPHESFPDDPPDRIAGRGRWRLHFPPELPVSARADELIAAIREHQVLIVAGDTGSGKTTQLPKLCLAAGRERIACTQPRRVAAVSLSRRVAEEMQVPWGRDVGCKIRFMDKTSPHTAVKFLTDGMLLAEVQSDPMLRAYDTILIDEAHERSLNIDFLLGHLNQLRHRRRDLKIVVTSATIDTAAFSRAFDPAPVIQVSGRTYPVEVIYSPVDELLEEAGDFTHLDAVVVAVERILLESDRGDILVFLATERDIREVADLLEGRKLGPLDILPLFGRLSSGDQQRVFAPARHRKIVLSTNIAETSLTIPGIRFVVDTGEARLSRFNNRTRTRRLPIEPISQSSADQRKGRCGRVAEGVCIRLYAEADFAKRPQYTPPEIQRANLADVILRMKSARLGDIERFPFIDAPPPAAVRAGYVLLEELGAIDATPARALTPLGRELARLPVDPIVGRMLLQAVSEKAVREVLVVAAALSIQDPRERPADAEAAADAAHRRFVHPESDFLTLLAIWDAFHDDVERLSQGRLRKYCRQHFLNYARMREWRDIHAQLEEALRDSAEGDRSAAGGVATVSEADLRFGGERYRAIHRSLLPGLLVNVAHREEGNAFRAGGERRVVVFPGSTLFDRKSRPQPREQRGGRQPPKPLRNPDWIVAAEIVETTRLYARTCAKIDPAWVLELGAHVLAVSHSEPTFTLESGRVLARETTRLHGLELRIRSVGYDKIDAKRATEIFIREGLLNDELKLPLRFLEHNRRVRDKVEVLRTRMRSGAYLDLDQAMYRFYGDRLEDVSSVHDLNRVVRARIGREPDFLCVREEDLLGDLPADFDRAAFPDRVELSNSALPIHYAYKPGQENDGVTLRLAPGQVGAVSSGMLDWLVPGHLEEKILALLRGLPKDVRRRLIPMPEAAARLAREVRPTHATLAESLAAYLEKRDGIRTFPSDWKTEELPEHLRVRVEVVDDHARTLVASRDVAQVQALLEQRRLEAARRPEQGVVEAWRRAAAKWEKTGLETWSFDELPERVLVTESAGLEIHAYPGLRLESDGVALRLFKTPEEARIDLAAGLEKFFAFELRYELSWLERDLKDVRKLGPLAVTLAPLEELQRNVREHLLRRLCRRMPTALTRTAFAQAAEAARAESKGLLWRLLDQIEAVLKLRQEMLVQMPPYKDAARDLARLVPKDFPANTSEAGLKHLPRWLRAMQGRGRKARESAVRDAERAKEIAQVEARVAAVDKAGRLSEAARAEVAWMLEELRVSIFAQELGTAFPVSAKRIEKRLAEMVP
jgi:ATP-dependent helicase HrpA